MKMRVVIVDDDPVNNFICRETIKMSGIDCDVVDFTRPEDGVEYIAKNYSSSSENPKTILLLDLNMDRMTGWEFLEEFYKFDPAATKGFCIYILSSSLDSTDRATARQMPGVRDFVVKPLKVEVLEKILKSV